MVKETSKEPSYLTDLSLAYDEFVVKLLSKLTNEANLAELYYNLSYVRLELVEICNDLSDGQEKK